MDQRSRLMCNSNIDLNNFQTNFCPNYLKNVSYKARKWDCPLCDDGSNFGRYNDSPPFNSDSILSFDRKFPSYKNNEMNWQEMKGNNSKKVQEDILRQKIMQKAKNGRLNSSDDTKFSSGDSFDARNKRRMKQKKDRVDQKKTKAEELEEKLKQMKAKNGKSRTKKKNESDESNLSQEISGNRLKRSQKLTKMKQKKTKSGYSYSFGRNSAMARHQAMLNHYDCAQVRGLVPKNMGWLWNVPTLGINKLRLGWKPGAVSKPIKRLMMHFLNNYPCDTLIEPKVPQKPPKNDFCCFNPCNRSALLLKKENDKYSLCIRPLKASTPTKNDIDKTLEQKKLDYCRCALRKKGFCECQCLDPGCCRCRTLQEKQQLVFEMQKLSKEVGLKNVMKNQDFTYNARYEDLEDNFHIEFTPPGMMGKGKNVSSTKAAETQFNDKDFMPEKPEEEKKDTKKSSKDKKSSKEKKGSKDSVKDKKDVKKGGKPATSSDKKKPKK